MPTPPTSCCASRASTTSTSTGGSARPRPRSTSARASCTLADGARVAFDGLVHRDRLDAAPAARTSPSSPACSCCARSTTRSRCARRSTRCPKVVVIGAGFIGAEVAATCRGRGLDVTVLEALPQPMVRGLGPELGAVIADMHRDHGVDLRTGVQVDAIEGDARVERVRLGDGTADRRRRRRGRRRVSCPQTAVARGLRAHDRQRRRVRRDLPRRAGHRRGRRHRPLAEPALRRRSSCGSSTGPTRPSRVCTRRGGCSPATAPASRSRRCRSCGPTSTTARSRPSASCRPTPTCTSRTARTRSASSSRCSAEHGRIVGALGFNRPRQVMQYRKLIAERATLGRRAGARERMSSHGASARADLHAPLHARRAERALLLHRARDAHAGAARLRREVARARQHRGRDRGRRVRGRARSCCARSRVGSATPSGGGCSSSAAR